MGVSSMCVHGTADDDVPLSQSQRFVAAARRAGDDSRLLVLPGTDHCSLADVTPPGVGGLPHGGPGSGALNLRSRHRVTAVWTS